MPQFQLFNSFIGYIGDSTINLSTHSFKIGLSNVAPDPAADTVWADITEIAAGNGYTAGGDLLTAVTWTELSPGVWRWSTADQTWTASGGNIATNQYIVVYDDTPTSPADPLVGFLDRGVSNGIVDGNSLSVNVGANGWILAQEV